MRVNRGPARPPATRRPTGSLPRVDAWPARPNLGAFAGAILKKTMGGRDTPRFRAKALKIGHKILTAAVGGIPLITVFLTALPRWSRPGDGQASAFPWRRSLAGGVRHPGRASPRFNTTDHQRLWRTHPAPLCGGRMWRRLWLPVPVGRQPVRMADHRQGRGPRERRPAGAGLNRPVWITNPGMKHEFDRPKPRFVDARALSDHMESI